MGDLQPSLELGSDCASPDHHRTDVGVITAKTSGAGDAPLSVPRVHHRSRAASLISNLNPFCCCLQRLEGILDDRNPSAHPSLAIPVVLSSFTLAGALFFSVFLPISHRELPGIRGF